MADAKPVTNFHSDKARALLAYVALEPQPHSRRALAALLWPEIGEKYALANLRNTLFRLRQTLDTAVPEVSAELLNVTRQAVQCNTEAAAIDALRFQRLLDVLSEANRTPVPDADENDLADAVALYEGELLAGFAVNDAPNFDEWLLLRREMLHERALLAFRTLAERYEEAQEYERAYLLARRLVSLDPFREDAYQRMMRVLARLNRSSQALKLFDEMLNRFRTELGIVPSEETQTLAKRIAAGDFGPLRVDDDLVGNVRRPAHAEGAQRDTQQIARAVSAKSEASQTDKVDAASSDARTLPIADFKFDLSEVPQVGPFFGRDHERRSIQNWLQTEQCRVVAILGIGGVGKTSLAAHCVHQIASDANHGGFDLIYWRSLLNAPPLEQMLPPLLQMLAELELAALPQRVDEQMQLLLRYLRSKRVLLVLDNVESIMVETQAGAYRPGYEAYGQLIRQMATFEHRSHLLLTSRERPKGYALLEGDIPAVRSLLLEGLDVRAGLELLAQRGVRQDPSETTALVQRYSGNPLALKLVAETVEEVFGGDIAEFLQVGSVVFDDVRIVLDQQFARLSALEQTVLLWLAVEREAVPLQQLRKNLLGPPMQREVVEALRNLLRRSLIERYEAGFALQNVVTEYLTGRLIDQAIREVESGEIDWLNRVALLKAQSKAHIRESQARLILGPIAAQLRTQLGPNELRGKIADVLAQLRNRGVVIPGYAAGNMLDLMLESGLGVNGADFSSLYIRQAHLQGRALHDVDFSRAEFDDCTFTNNFGRVKALAISADNYLLALGTDDGEIRLWRLDDGRLVRLLRGHRGLVISLAFSPDSGYLASSSSLDGTVFLWDVSDGAKVTTFETGAVGVEVVTFNADGTLLAAGGHDGAIRLWDTRSFALVQVLEKHTDWVTDLAFSPNGDLLASAGMDQSQCYLWQRTPPTDVQEEDVAYTFGKALAGHQAFVFALKFSPDGTQLATASGDQTVRLWNVAQHTCLRVVQAESDEIRSLVFSQDGANLFVAGVDRLIRVWDVTSGRLINILRKHQHHIWGLAISGDGNTLASGGSDGIVHLWDVQNVARAYVMSTLHGHVQPIYALALAPQGDGFATGEDGGRVHQWQLADGNATPPRQLEGHTALVDDLAYSPDGRWLFTGGHDKMLRIWDVASGTCVEMLYMDGLGSARAACHPNSKLIACRRDTTIFLWDISLPGRSRLVAEMTGHTESIRALSFSPDGRYFASCSLDDTVRLWDLGDVPGVETPTCVHVFDEGIRSFWSIMFSPDGRRLAGGGRSGIHVWDLSHATRAPIEYTSMAAISNVRPVAFSTDGKQLVAGGIDRTVRVWDLEADIEVLCMEGHSADVTSTFFLPEDDGVISASYDGTVRLWDAGRPGATGKCRQVMQIPGPYAGMRITGVTGITDALRSALKALGAEE